MFSWNTRVKNTTDAHIFILKRPVSCKATPIAIRSSSLIRRGGTECSVLHSAYNPF